MATYEYTVDLLWNGPGSPGVNVWHFRTDILDGAQDCVNVIAAFYDGLRTTELLPAGSIATGRDQAIDVASREIQPVTGFVEDMSSGVADFAGPCMMVVTLATSSASRAGRGRKFVGPVGENCLSPDGTPTSAAVVALQGVGNALVSASEGLDGAAIGVYSERQNLFRDLTQARVRDTFAVLRSRRD